MRFSQREREVLDLLVLGKTNREIQEVLKCSMERVKDVMRGIARKTGFHNRTMMAAWWAVRPYEDYLAALCLQPSTAIIARRALLNPSPRVGWGYKGEDLQPKDEHEPNDGSA